MYKSEQQQIFLNFVLEKSVQVNFNERKGER